VRPKVPLPLSAPSTAKQLVSLDLTVVFLQTTTVKWGGKILLGGDAMSIVCDASKPPLVFRLLAKSGPILSH